MSLAFRCIRRKRSRAVEVGATIRTGRPPFAHRREMRLTPGMPTIPSGKYHARKQLFSCPGSTHRGSWRTRIGGDLERDGPTMDGSTSP